MKNVKAIAFGGIIAALSVVIVFLGSLIAIFKILGPLIAGIILIFQKELFGFKSAIFTYIAVAFLLAFIAPSKISAYVYAVGLGYYPIIYTYFDRIKNMFLRLVIRVVMFESIGGISIALGLYFMPNIKDNERFTLMLVGGVIIYNVFVVIYNLFLYVFYAMMESKWKNKIKKIVK